MRVTKEELRDILAPLIERFKAYVDKRLAEIPAPKDGAPGKDADPEAVRALVAKAVSELPAPQDGAPGKDGAPGADGASVALEDVLPVVEAGFSRWALDFERRAADVLQRAAERIPVPRDGIDGMSIENLTVEDDGDGRVTLKFSRGELSREFTIRLPRFKDMGVFRDGQAHKEGDGVTFGGSFWIAQMDDPPGKPGDPDSGWRLAVKKGRDGKDGGGPAAPRGPVRVG